MDRYCFGKDIKEKKGKVVTKKAVLVDKRTILLSGILNRIIIIHQNTFDADNRENESDTEVFLVWKNLIFCTSSDKVLLPPEKKEEDFLGESWVWNKWEKIGNDDSFPFPIEIDHCSSSHRLEHGITNNFGNILQYMY